MHENQTKQRRVCDHYLLEQTTDASSWWPQLCEPQPPCGQFTMEVSLPKQLTSSNQIWPLPEPKCAELWALTAPEYPSSRHMTLASSKSQLSSHTVPQSPLYKISTLPSPFQLPPTSLSPETSAKVEDRPIIIKGYLLRGVCRWTNKLWFSGS